MAKRTTVLKVSGLRRAYGPVTILEKFSLEVRAGEAVALAARCRPRFVVPHHYDMFTFNTVPVEEFEVEARGLPEGVTPKVLRCGERWEIGS